MTYFHSKINCLIMNKWLSIEWSQEVQWFLQDINFYSTYKASMNLLILTKKRVTLGLFFQSTIPLQILLSCWQTPYFIFQGWIIILAFDFHEKSISFQLSWSPTAKSSLTRTMPYTNWHTSYVGFFPTIFFWKQNLSFH